MGDLDIPTSNIKLDALVCLPRNSKRFCKTCCTWGYQGAQEHDVLGVTKELMSFDKTCCTWGYQGAQGILTRI